MWGKVDERDGYLEKAIEFTGNAAIYGKWMLDVVDSWPISCEQNLSNLTQNRQAWIGHAACALAFGCPEDIVREAWGKLTEEQQRMANNVASIAIKKWENKNAEAEPWENGLSSCTGTYSLDF